MEELYNKLDMLDPLTRGSVEMQAKASMIREFEKNVVWLDIKATLTERIVCLRDKLEIMGGGFASQDFVYTQAEIAGCRYMLDLPKLLLSLLKEESEENEE